MPSHHISNEELTRLLHKFATKDGSQPEIRNAQRTFFNYLNRELDQHVRRVVNYNEDIAQVAMQEAWIKILESANKYDPAKASVKTWAKMISANCAIDQLRAYYKRIKILAQCTLDKGTDDAHSPKKTSPVVDGSDLAGGYAEEINHQICPLLRPDDQVYANQLQQAIKACIEILPSKDGPNFRQAMELCLDEDLSYAQMMSILAAQSPRYADLNVEQVRGWVRQAKLRMQHCISQKLGWNNDGNTDRSNP
ncbi:RNA polymerase sigma factor [Undibacterium sp. SXout20W]|uniref:RNA polymerase sigma factor n=1 Tax=Undibacterium sp. SXout20W TaxID=3413051 RepID=UPI003BF08205